MKKRILVDFDGVLHSYTSGWQGARNIPDPPVPGAVEWLCAALETFDVAIFSSRSHAFGGRRAMKGWLRKVSREFFLASEGHVITGAWLQMGYNTAMDPWDVVCDDAARHLVKRLEWPRHKVPAHLQLDDRAWCFGGEFPPLREMAAFQPWWKHVEEKG